MDGKQERPFFQALVRDYFFWLAIAMAPCWWVAVTINPRAPAWLIATTGISCLAIAVIRALKLLP